MIKNKQLLHATTWIKLTDTILSKKDRPLGYVLYDFIYIKFQTAKIN